MGVINYLFAIQPLIMARKADLNLFNFSRNKKKYQIFRVDLNTYLYYNLFIKILNNNGRI